MMRCSRCGREILRDETGVCVACRLSVVDEAPPPPSGRRPNHVGRIRSPTPAELERRERWLEPDAVLTLVEGRSEQLPLRASGLVGLIDGFRPVARLWRKSGLSIPELRAALSSLAASGAVRLTGVVEDAGAAPPRSEPAPEEASRRVTDAAMILSASVMADIDEMTAADRALDDDATEEMALPPPDDDS